MCELTNHMLLSQTEKASISKCKCCGNYSVIFNNLHLALSDEQLKNLINTFKNLHSDDFNKVHPNGQEHVLLKNNRSYVGISFSREDVNDLLELFREASLVEEVFSILYDE